MWWFVIAAAWLGLETGPTSELVRQQSNSKRHDIYIVAHQDDWQLFLGDVVVSSLKAGIPATFIYLTAGDDGRDSSYWMTRERGALRSVAIAIGALRDSVPTCDTVRVRAHPVRRCRLGNTTSFFLRLPDGGRNGAGFERSRLQSLRKLRIKRIDSIVAVDASTTYAGWSDLALTADSLIKRSAGDLGPVLHTTDPSIAINPHDHFDHRMAGRLVEEIRARERWTARYYVGYALASRAANLKTAQAREKTAVFRAYDEVMIRGSPRWSAYAEHPRFYSDCLLRTYSRTVPRPESK